MKSNDNISEKFKSYVANRDIRSIRTLLCAIINSDPTLTKGFKERLEYALTNGIKEEDLYESNKGIIKNDISLENFTNLVVALELNFSKEKIEAIKKIGFALYGAKEGCYESTSSNQNSNNTSYGQKSYTYDSAKGISGLLQYLFEIGKDIARGCFDRLERVFNGRLLNVEKELKEVKEKQDEIEKKLDMLLELLQKKEEKEPTDEI